MTAEKWKARAREAAEAAVAAAMAALEVGCIEESVVQNLTRDFAAALAEAAAEERELWDDRVDELEEAFHRIAQWADAYPLDIFPEPDLKKAANLLKAGGITIDSVSAHVARHVIEGVGKIAREVLSRSPEPQTQKGSRPAEAEREPS